MKHVFLSYAETDHGIAEQIVGALRTIEGVRPWAYHLDFVPGPEHLATTRTEIERSAFVIALVSTASTKSEFVNDEIFHAVAKKKDFLPVLIDLDYETLGALKPKWTTAFGFATGIDWKREDTIRRIVAGCRHLLNIEDPTSPSATAGGETFSLPPFLKNREPIQVEYEFGDGEPPSKGKWETDWRHLFASLAPNMFSATQCWNIEVLAREEIMEQLTRERIDPGKDHHFRFSNRTWAQIKSRLVQAALIEILRSQNDHEAWKLTKQGQMALQAITG